MEIKSLGILTYEQKKEYWKSHISGSQIKRIIDEPIAFLNEKWGLTPEIIPGEDPNATESFNSYVKMRINEGRALEDVIIKICQGKYENIPEMKILKDTFIVEGKRYSANIDGYIGKDRDNIESIVEVKDSTVNDYNKIIERYIYQIMFYMWFFNAKSCWFLVRQTTNKWITTKTFKFQKPYTEYLTEKIERDPIEESKMLDKIDTWIKAYETKNVNLITWGDK